MLNIEIKKLSKNETYFLETALALGSCDMAKLFGGRHLPDIFKPWETVIRDNQKMVFQSHIYQAASWSKPRRVVAKIE
jgi:hypothetical protein